MKRKWLKTIALAAATTMLLGSSVQAEQIIKMETDTKTADAGASNMNLLTGENTLSEYAVGKRPVAVMINNVQAAMPQSGIGSADVLFEIPVEGDLTRLMAVYGDLTAVPRVCSVRSCRYYYPILAVGFDAFYAHWGMDDTIARETLNSMEIDHLDGMNNDYNLFGRDQSRLDQGYSLEHTAYFDGPRFSSEIGEARIELKDEKKGPAFSFVDYGTVVKPNGDACNSVNIEFGASSTGMKYDAATNTYLMSHDGEPQVEATTGAQAAFDNVIILETDISVRDDVGRKNVNWEGGPEAKGYYISNGAMQEIRWSKADMYAYLKFTDVNGQELKINRGNTYIAMNYANQATFS